MCAIFHGHWLRGDGWMGRGRIDSTLSLFPLPPILLLPSIQLHLCFRGALSSGGIPSYQTKCIRTFSLQIWKFLWPFCLKFWFQSSKQWSTSCSKGWCHPHKQKCENSNISNSHQRWRPCEGTGTWERYVCVSFVAPLPPPPYWVKHQAGNISKCRAPLICRSGKDGCWGAVSWARHGPGKLLLSYRCLVLHGIVLYKLAGRRNNLFTVLTRVPPPHYTVLTRPEWCHFISSIASPAPQDKRNKQQMQMQQTNMCSSGPLLPL